MSNFLQVMRFACFLALLAMAGCSLKGRQVKHEEFLRAPKFKWEEDKLIIVVDPDNPFSIDNFDVQMDTAEMEIALKGFTSDEKKSDLNCQVPLPYTPKLYSRYMIAWVDSDGTRNNLRRVVNFGGKNCLPYFTYDAIEHFHSDVSADLLSRLSEKLSLTHGEQSLLNFVVDKEFDHLSDTVSLKNLKSMGFSQKDIKQSQFQNIDDILCQTLEPTDADLNITLCVPYYRDVLLFKKNGSVVGYAKICFTCHENMFVGTDKNTWEFNSREKFEALQEVLDIKETFY